MCTNLHWSQTSNVHTPAHHCHLESGSNLISVFVLSDTIFLCL